MPAGIELFFDLELNVGLFVLYEKLHSIIRIRYVAFFQ